MSDWTSLGDPVHEAVFVLIVHSTRHSLPFVEESALLDTRETDEHRRGRQERAEGGEG